MGAARKKAVKTATDSTTVLDPRTVPGEGFAVIVDKKRLKAALARFQSVVDRKSTMTMLSAVRISAGSDGVTFYGTDLNISLTLRMRGDHTVIRNGEACVSAKAFADLVKTMPDGDLQLTLADRTKLAVSGASGTATAVLEGYHPRDFPKIPNAEEATKAPDPWTEIDGDDLLSVLNRVQHAICRDETRFHLNGTHLEMLGSTMRAVSTDGHRLAKAERDLAYAGPHWVKSVLVPRKGCTEIDKLLAPGKASVAIDKHMIFVRQGDETLAIKTIDAQFPPWEQVVPTGHERLATLDRRALLDAAKRAQVNCSDTRGMRLTFATGKLVVSGDDPDKGEIRAEIVADYHRDDSFEIGVNAKYLLDTLTTIADDSVVMAFGTESKSGMLDPILVRGIDDASMRPVMGAGFLSVVMPMRI